MWDGVQDMMQGADEGQDAEREEVQDGVQDETRCDSDGVNNKR
jgi:hypothetical protein